MTGEKTKPLAAKTDLSNIKPKRTVKIKSRKPKKIDPPRQQPKVIQNVRENVSEDQVPPPTEDTVKILAQLNNLKTQLVGAMKAFNKILSDQTLSVNKSKQDKDVEQKIINDLVLAARGVDEISPGEGTLGVCVFAVRQALSLRDAGNKLAYELYQIKNRLDQIETDIYEEESGEK